MSTKQNHSTALFPILLVNFIGTMGYGIVLPFLIVIVLALGGNEIIYGTLAATYSLFQLIGAPILGKWSDKVGRRKVLLISQGGTFIAWVIFLFALIIPSDSTQETDTILFLSVPLALLFIARALDGITGGNVSVANAYLADISDENNRKQNFGKMSAAANLGFIAGPALAGILGATLLGEILPVAAALFISFMAIIVIAFQLRETNPCLIEKPVDPTRNRKVFGQEHKECHELPGEKDASFVDVILGQRGNFIILYFLIFLAFNFYYVAFPVYATTEMKWTVFELGIFFSIMSGVMVLVQGPILSRLSKKFNEEQLIISGALLLIASFAFFTNHSLPGIIAAVLLFSCGNGIMWPSFLSLLSTHAGKQQGAVQGYASSAGSLASIIGLLSGAFLYKYLHSATFFISALLMLMVLIYFLYTNRKLSGSELANA